MNRSEIAGRVTLLNSKDPKALAAFSQQLADDARDGPRGLVDLLMTRPAGLAPEVPRMLIQQIQDLAIVPLMELSAEKTPPADFSFGVRTLADATIRFRDAVIKRCITLLDVTTAVPQIVIPDVEAQPQPRRICDEAYMVLRRLVKTEEDHRDTALEADAFLSRPEIQRDAIIKTLKKSKTFTDLVARPPTPK